MKYHRMEKVRYSSAGNIPVSINQIAIFIRSREYFNPSHVIFTKSVHR